MELLILLPILLGLAVFSLFDSDSSDTGNVPNVDPNTPLNPQESIRVGTSAADNLSGGLVGDFMLGGAEQDTISGNAGYDVLLGEGGNDALYGGRGYDSMFGGGGNDRMFGLDGNDYLLGGLGSDLIYGGAGNDTMVGTNAADTLYGDGGNDLISGYDPSTGDDVLGIQFAGTPAQGAKALSDLKAAVASRFGDDVAGTGATITDLTNRLDASIREVNTNTADDMLYGGVGNDTIMADYSDTITGGGGNDVIFAYSDGAGQAVTITDFNPVSDKLNLYIPGATNPTYTLVNGSSPSVGVSVVVGGDVVAVLRGLTASNIPTGAIVLLKA